MSSSVSRAVSSDRVNQPVQGPVRPLDVPPFRLPQPLRIVASPGGTPSPLMAADAWPHALLGAGHPVDPFRSAFAPMPPSDPFASHYFAPPPATIEAVAAARPSDQETSFEPEPEFGITTELDPFAASSALPLPQWTPSTPIVSESSHATMHEPQQQPRHRDDLVEVASVETDGQGRHSVFLRLDTRALGGSTDVEIVSTGPGRVKLTIAGHQLTPEQLERLSSDFKADGLTVESIDQKNPTQRSSESGREPV